MAKEDVDVFVDDIDTEQAWNDGGRPPKLTVGDYLLEVVNLGTRYSKKQDKDYFELVGEIVESTSAAHPKGTQACVQIWPTKFKIHVRKTKALFEALLPGKKLTAQYCKKLIAEDLLCGTKVRCRVTLNTKGYPEERFMPAPEEAA